MYHLLPLKAILKQWFETTILLTILWGSSLGWDQLGSYAGLNKSGLPDQLTGLTYASVVSCCVDQGLAGLGWLKLGKHVCAPFVSPSAGLAQVCLHGSWIES